MEIFKTILDWAGYPGTIVAIIATLSAVILWFSGILPVLIALGNGLARRKIAIFAKGGNLSGIRLTLLDSKLFKKRNLIEVERLQEIDIAKKADVLVVYWPDWSEHIIKILNDIKEDSKPLIVYCPFTDEKIPREMLIAIDNKRNTSVTNFRGRLLNDIVTAMITTSYEK